MAPGAAARVRRGRSCGSTSERFSSWPLSFFYPPLDARRLPPHRLAPARRHDRAPRVPDSSCPTRHPLAARPGASSSAERCFRCWGCCRSIRCGSRSSRTTSSTSPASDRSRWSAWRSPPLGNRIPFLGRTCGTAVCLLLIGLTLVPDRGLPLDHDALAKDAGEEPGLLSVRQRPGAGTDLACRAGGGVPQGDPDGTAVRTRLEQPRPDSGEAGADGRALRRRTARRSVSSRITRWSMPGWRRSWKTGAIYRGLSKMPAWRCGTGQDRRSIPTWDGCWR